MECIKVLRNLVLAETSARCPKTGVCAIFLFAVTHFLPCKKKIIKKILMLDVPKGVKLPKQTKSFRKFCPLTHLVNIFHR